MDTEDTENRDSEKEYFWGSVDAELAYADKKHLECWPRDPIHAAAIVAEEAGKLVQAANDFACPLPGKNREESLARMERMAARVAAMALNFSVNLSGYVRTRPGHLRPEN